jgi:hypothetical protein
MYTAIKTFKGACKTVGVSDTLPDFSFAPEQHRQALIDHYKLVIINQAINGDWKPDWNDNDQPKWFPWFNLEGGFELSVVVYDYQCTFAGSRLCFFSSEAAKYAATQFHNLYKSYFTL